MAFVQLDPPIPLHVLGKGPGFAIAVIDYGQEHNLIWVTAINETGEVWRAEPPGSDGGELDHGTIQIAPLQICRQTSRQRLWQRCFRYSRRGR